MTNHEKEILKQAASIIQHELKTGREVKVPGFGKMYISRVKWTDNDSGTFGTVNTVRFKPFGGLKEAVGNRRVDGTLGEQSKGFESKAPVVEPRKPAPVVQIHR